MVASANLTQCNAIKVTQKLRRDHSHHNLTGAQSYAAFHWAQKLVFTSFPGGNIVPLKSEVVCNSEFCEHPDFRLGNTSWEIRVSEPNGTQH